MLGEAEDVLPQLIEDMRAGSVRPSYEGGRPDLSRIPPPRWDLIDLRSYVTMAVQFSLIRTMDECSRHGSSISIETVRAQADDLLVSVVRTLEGDEETAVVKHLMKLRRSLDHVETGEELTGEADTARAEVINIVNNFFHDKLTGLPAIKVYIDDIQGK